MDFAFSRKVRDLQARVQAFMDEDVYPAEPVHREQVREADDPYVHPQIVEDLKAEARRRGLWNLFLPDERWGAGLSNLEYAPLAEITGRSPWLAPEAMNCSAAETGYMEILAEVGSAEQQDVWLKPLLDGVIR
jgi:acyl-CoA dehydrogenase